MPRHTNATLTSISGAASAPMESAEAGCLSSLELQLDTHLPPPSILLFYRWRSPIVQAGAFLGIRHPETSFATHASSRERFEH